MQINLTVFSLYLDRVTSATDFDFANCAQAKIKAVTSLSYNILEMINDVVSLRSDVEIISWIK